MAHDTALISLSGVARHYPGGVEALRGVSLQVARGDLVVVSGPSGAGKTTLLRLMAAIERPTAGSVLVNGQNVAALRPRAIPWLRRNFGLVFQDHKLLSDRSLFHNVALPLRIAGFEPREAARRVRAALDKVGLLHRERAMPAALSGGEQQRACIARAIVHRPAIVLADEPTANLDMAYASDIVSLLGAFHGVGSTLVIATHDVAAFTPLGPRQVYLCAGLVGPQMQS
ncbi:MAG: ATP-binding cassette domain-containing protein [Rhodocyclaceae bacterium]|jgi:cell division transport system ATP-binding protein|nr:ATP-binding cassette domain-containing protein [Rhodocyclaceae bacterium]MCA3135893.1 ATP-binding cassette domain-containing protein [Rhodocyclaceae bacterium]MCA3140824.1 ATP-binding cassette domain-containing protein [Rhodocyclaceae bacterium]MCA3145999.1 ATP-binding cassette domain-containing protein [Rhodocyclaceae bacterium]MCE2899322.1 ATP-binding cassette domain-containing protein [Betaproteobacteria bacterium]